MAAVPLLAVIGAVAAAGGPQDALNVRCACLPSSCSAHRAATADSLHCSPSTEHHKRGDHRRAACAVLLRTGLFFRMHCPASRKRPHPWRAALRSRRPMHRSCRCRRPRMNRSPTSLVRRLCMFVPPRYVQALVPSSDRLRARRWSFRALPRERRPPSSSPATSCVAAACILNYSKTRGETNPSHIYLFACSTGAPVR